MAKFDLRLRLRASNLKEFGKQLKEELRKAVKDIEIWRGFGDSMVKEIRMKKREIKKEIDDINKDAARGVIRKAPSIWEEYLPEEEISGGRRGRKRTGIIGRITGFLGKESPILMSLMSIGYILSMIYDAVVRLVQMGETFSGYGQAMLKILRIIFDLALKPIADIISMMLLPILLMILKYVIIPWSKITNSPEIKKMFTPPKNPAEALLWYAEKLSFGTPLGLANIPFFDMLKKYLMPRKVEKPVEESVIPLAPIKRLIEFLKGIRLPSINVVLGKFLEFAAELGKGLEDAKEQILRFIGFIVYGFKEVWRDIHSIYSGGDAPISKIIGAFQAIESKLSFLIRRNGVVDKIVSVFEVIAEYLVKAYNAVESELSNIVGGIRSVISSAGGVIGGVEKAVGGAVSWVANALGLQTGGYISSSGIYYLHSGEMVVPAGRVATNISEYTINININANVRNDMDIRRIANEVERVLKDKMSRRGAFR